MRCLGVVDSGGDVHGAYALSGFSFLANRVMFLFKALGNKEKAVKYYAQLESDASSPLLAGKVGGVPDKGKNAGVGAIIPNVGDRNVSLQDFAAIAKEAREAAERGEGLGQPPN